MKNQRNQTSMTKPGVVNYRVASCFVQGLAERLSLVQPLGGDLGFATPPMMNIMDVSISNKKEEALSLVFENCPHIQFVHFVANETILEEILP
ncbi:hypothetical protein CMV_002290 [Castanea mollissima]|uniref:Uncharacterized protein n=1 Tax=Castanea mollissima TaxID=60419 RepID=A0A8J4RQE2_9ROSI|nr:hypothetical protein CMV_002290 [Castanea mollissima]